MIQYIFVNLTVFIISFILMQYAFGPNSEIWKMPTFKYNRKKGILSVIIWLLITYNSFFGVDIFLFIALVCFWIITVPISYVISCIIISNYDKFIAQIKK
ncbi:MAG: hypothetical protein V1900_00060 [Candidatus Aenigmatarchaeota archaeon]